ncbi:MAG: hypothetical protein K9L24_03105 [Spirochaetia bacterium]|nr:hypothetical protein [Spirochaetia bacterium]MCF7954127.1 hypothetical protein [Spirochaetales bacterium]
MMRMEKRVLLYFVIIFSGCAFLEAGDFGVTWDFTSSSELIVDSDPSNSNALEAKYWANTALGKNSGFEFQASSLFSSDQSTQFDIDQCEYHQSFYNSSAEPSVIEYIIGRTAAADFSGKVFSHTGDGMKASWTSQNVSFKFFTLYTGFMQTAAVNILMTESDEADYTEAFSSDSGNFSSFASPRFIEGASLSLSDIFDGKTLTLAALFQQDLRAGENVREGDALLDSQYYGTGLSGPLNGSETSSLSMYAWFFRGSHGEQDLSGFLTGAQVIRVFPEFYAGTINLEAVYSSGDPEIESLMGGGDGEASEVFLPITATPSGKIFSPQQSNVFSFRGSGSIRPYIDYSSKALRNIMLSVDYALFFRSTTGAISVSGVDSSCDELFLGSEFFASTTARITSDVGASIGGGVFIPSHVFLDEKYTWKVQAGFSVSM